jgi:tetratricopeptide (TPR) repeat protein
MAALQPRDAGIAADLARQYRLLGQPAASRAALETALALDPDNIQALAEAGDQASQSDDHAAALVFHQAALAAAPEAAAHHLRVARLLHDLERHAEADAALQAAERRFGRTAEIWGETIRRLRERGETHRALAEARAAQVAHPLHFGRWSDRFSLEFQLSPVATVAHCISLAPAQSRAEDAQVLAAQARLAMGRREPERAIALFEAALALQPEDRGFLTELFGLHLRALELPQAATYHSRLAALEAHGRRMRGTTANASQSHHGQLLNDFLVDRSAVAELAAIRAAAAETRIAGFLAFTRARPDHIPGSMATLIALRRGGWLDRPAAAAAASGAGQRLIPSRIVQFWDAEEPPGDLLDISRSWAEQNPDHEYLLFNDRTAQAYLAAHFPPAIAMAYRRCDSATVKADLFRLAVLLRQGGVWADMDDRCLEPLPALLPPAVAACFWQEGSGHLCNNFFAAVPGHPVLRRALVTAVNAINRGDRDKVWMLTGPGLLSRAFTAELGAAGAAWPAWLRRNAVLDEFAIHPCIAIHCRTSHKKQGKHWMKTAFAPPIAPPIAPVSVLPSVAA